LTPTVDRDHLAECKKKILSVLKQRGELSLLKTRWECSEFDIDTYIKAVEQLVRYKKVEEVDRAGVL